MVSDPCSLKAKRKIIQGSAGMCSMKANLSRRHQMKTALLKTF